MSEKEPSAKSVLEIHEEFLQHVESGSAKIKTLSVATIVVAGILVISYVYQIITPYLYGQTYVPVNLRDPTLVAFEVILTIVAILWLYVGVRDYMFVARLAKSIGRARALEKDIEREISGNQAT